MLITVSLINITIKEIKLSISISQDQPGANYKNDISMTYWDHK